MDNSSQIGFIIAVLNGQNTGNVDALINQYKEEHTIKAKVYPFADFEKTNEKAYRMIHDDLLTIEEATTAPKNGDKKELSAADYANIEAQLKEHETGKKSNNKETRKEDIIASILENADFYGNPGKDKYSIAISFMGDMTQIIEFTNYIKAKIPVYAEKYLQVRYDFANEKIVLLEDVSLEEDKKIDINLAEVAPSA